MILKESIAAVDEWLKKGLKIERTEEYDKFKFLSANRSVNESHVGNLVASFVSRYILNPIIINENFEIIDGQHRFCAAQRLGMPIYYIRIPGLTIRDCLRLNEKQKSWSEENFIRCYATLGDENYIRLVKCIDMWKCQIRYPLYVCHRKASRGDAKVNPVKAGTLVFTEDDIQLFNERYPKILELAKALDIKAKSLFVLAATKMMDNPDYNHMRMLANAKRCGKDKFHERTTVDGYMEELSEVYNYGRSNKSKVYFEKAAA